MSHAIPTASPASPTRCPAGAAVLDVREHVEWAHGHIEGALHIPLTGAAGPARRRARRQQDLVVCKVGGRSAQAVAYLRRAGPRRVNLDGGMLDWAGAGRPHGQRADGPPRVV